MITRRALLFLAALAAGLSTVPAGAADLHFGTAEIVIVSATGRHPFHVEVATTPAQMERGLMFRKHLAADAGMLFDFGAPIIVHMWMHNTLIPLDMLFVDQAGRIVNIAERARPLSDKVISAAAPVRAVIELPGGAAARLDIRPGDHVLTPLFGSTSPSPPPAGGEGRVRGR